MHSIKTILFGIALLCGWLLPFHTAKAQLTVWTNLTGGDFYDAANWTLGGPPDITTDGIFDVPATYTVNLNQTDNVKDLFFQNGSPTINGGNTLSFNQITVESTGLSPNVVFDDVTLLGSEFSLLSNVGQPANALLTNETLLSVSSMQINAPSTGIINQLQTTAGTDIVTGQLFIDAGDLDMHDSTCVVLSDCNIFSAPGELGQLTAVDSCLFAQELNVDEGLIILTASMADIESTISLSGAANIYMYGDSVIECEELNLGDGATPGFLRCYDTNSAVNGTINVGATSWLLCDTATLTSELVNVEGILSLFSDEGQVENSGVNAPVTIQPAGGISVIQETVGAINGRVRNLGGDVVVDPDCELVILDNYVGQNNFFGAGTKQFRGEVQPDDLDEFAEDLVGTLTFFDGNVILTNQSTYVVNFIGHTPSDAHDKLVTDSNLLIQNAEMVVIPDPAAAYSFADGEVLKIIDVAGTRAGQFNGMPEGSEVWNDGVYELTISYMGGDGNDVTLTAAIMGVLLGDVNLDGSVNLLDVAPFVELLSNGDYQAEADINEDGSVDLLDVAPFVGLLGG